MWLSLGGQFFHNNDKTQIDYVDSEKEQGNACNEKNKRINLEIYYCVELYRNKSGCLYILINWEIRNNHGKFVFQCV